MKLELQIESKACLPKRYIYSFYHTKINEAMIIIEISRYMLIFSFALMSMVIVLQPYN